MDHSFFLDITGHNFVTGDNFYEYE